MTEGGARVTGANIDNLLNALAAAARAPDTGEMGYRAADAQALAVGVAHYLDRMIDGSEARPPGVGVEQLRVARFELGEAIVRGEAVGMATDVPGMRSRVSDFQERVNAALPSLLSALGLESD